MVSRWRVRFGVAGRKAPWGTAIMSLWMGVACGAPGGDLSASGGTRADGGAASGGAGSLGAGGTSSGGAGLGPASGGAGLGPPSGGGLGPASGGAHPGSGGSGGAPSGGGESGGGESGGAESDGGRGPGSGGASGHVGGAAASGGDPGSGGAAGECPFAGNISYVLSKEDNPTSEQQSAYEKIEQAMDKAVAFYNCYTQISKEITAHYVPSVATADGNPNGTIRFGSSASMNFVTAMHEISHVVGVGADSGFDPLIRNGVYTGPVATAKLRELTDDPAAEIHGDTQHFWPYGLNYESEWHSEQDGIFHCYIVTAIRQDMGWQ